MHPTRLDRFWNSKPQRVAHRRADKIRKRKVISIDNILVEENEIEFDVRCESGTCVKELYTVMRAEQTIGCGRVRGRLRRFAG